MRTRLALLFDLDGTLIDSIDLLLQSMEFAFEGRTHRPTRAEWTAGIGVPLRGQLAAWAADAVDADLLLNRYRDFQGVHLERLTSAYPGALDVLAWLRTRGHAIALVTSKGRGMTDRSLARVGMAQAFDLLVTAESTERHKPLPDPVWFALTQLGIPAERAIFVGDSTHDMHAGRAAGVMTAAACWGPFSREELAPALPDHWLRDMTELPSIVQQLETQRD